jgi:hypothetical protein
LTQRLDYILLEKGSGSRITFHASIRKLFQAINYFIELTCGACGCRTPFASQVLGVTKAFTHFSRYLPVIAPAITDWSPLRSATHALAIAK